MVAELLNCNIPFISVPYPYAADNHQKKMRYILKIKDIVLWSKKIKLIPNYFH